MEAMISAEVAEHIRCLEGHHVSVVLADGSRLDDCELVSAGRHGVNSLWLYANGADTIVPLGAVTGVWEVVSGEQEDVRHPEAEGPGNHSTPIN
jgi:hypothetical protein